MQEYHKSVMLILKQTPTCFLIDDDDDDKDFLQEALYTIDSALTCLRAKDGEEGISILSSGEILPSFILLDMNMPKMHGAECLTLLRQITHLSSIPIYVYTTAHCSQVLINHMMLTGADSVFRKPVRMLDLIKLLRSLVGKNN